MSPDALAAAEEAHVQAELVRKLREQLRLLEEKATPGAAGVPEFLVAEYIAVNKDALWYWVPDEKEGWVEASKLTNPGEYCKKGGVVCGVRVWGGGAHTRRRFAQPSQ